MSDVVLMSIEPEWVQKIFNRRKKYEYRKVAPATSPPFPVVVYSTSPQKEIVGEIEVVDSLSEPPNALIDQTIADTPHHRDEIRQYFGDRDVGHALGIGTIVEYDQPVSLSEMREKHNLNPPQNFSYITKEEYSSIHG